MLRFKDVPGWRTPYTIAEVGSNWRTLEDCLLSIRAAKAAGANAVKFQLFTYKDLYGIDKVQENSYELNPAWLPQLKAEADFYDINFLCSAFSPALAEKVSPYVNMHKVASSELYHRRLLETLGSLGKPVILSTAAATEPDIRQAMSYLKDVEVCLMYCVGAYPAKDVDVRCIRLLENLHPKLVGYSDHSTDIRVIPRVAMRNGAQVIEKHFTAIDGVTPDSGHSLNVKEFGLMVLSLKGKQANAFLGQGIEERDMQLKYKRRLKVTADIKQGDQLKENINFAAFRSLTDDAHALSPFLIDQVDGKMAAKDLSQGDGIGLGDFQ